MNENDIIKSKKSHSRILNNSLRYLLIEKKLDFDYKIDVNN